MFCYNCGSQLDEKAVICPHCGVQVRALSSDANAFGEKADAGHNAAATQTTAPAQQNANGENPLAIVGFVLSFFFAIVGLILSILGLKKAQQGAPYKGLATAGVVISAVSLGFTVLLSMWYGCMICSLIGAAGAF